MRPRLALALLLLGACGGPGEDSPAPPPRAEARAEAPATPAADTAFPTADTAALALAPGAAGEWRVRRLAHVPRYFLVRGWVDGRTLWGLTGSNPVLVQADGREYTAWGARAWEAELSPDGRRLAWVDERGVHVGARGEAPRRLLPREPRPAGVEGELDGSLLWSPDGARLLVGWRGEAGPDFAVVEVATGRLAPIPRRGEGYLLDRAFGWLDAGRVLFTAPPGYGTDGAPPPRGDLAVHEVAAGTHRRVASAGPGGVLRPLAPWGEGGLLVGEARPGPGPVRRYWAYDTRSWSRRAVALPAGERVAAHSATRALVVEEERSGEAARSRLWLWEEGRGARPLARVEGRELRVSWSPGGERVAVSAAPEGPDPASPGALRTRYLSWLLER